VESAAENDRQKSGWTLRKRIKARRKTTKTKGGEEREGDSLADCLKKRGRKFLEFLSQQKKEERRWVQVLSSRCLIPKWAWEVRESFL